MSAGRTHDLRAHVHSHAFADDGQKQRERALTAAAQLKHVTVEVQRCRGSAAA
jgi:hypothetical protein